VKKEAKLLFSKGVESLILSIELFNRPHDCARTHGVLIFMDHAMEMLLKASILQRGGRIREKRAKQTIGFDACVRRGLSEGEIKFLTKEQALTLQMINSLRDAAQHYILDISEQHLYLQAQAGLTVFRDLCRSVFNIEMTTQLPQRVLPLSTSAPTDLATLFDREIQEVRKLLRPGSRRKIEAYAKLRALAIVECSLQGEKVQPGEEDLRKITKQVEDKKSWDQIFPGVASISLTTEGYGPSLDLRISQKKGIPIRLVPEGTPGATVVAVKRVNELGYYKFGLNDLARQVKLTGPKTIAFVRYLNLKTDPECYKEFVVGKTKFGRYSDKAVKQITKALKAVTVEEVWKLHGMRWKKK
jgi:hypothetical protein